MFNDSGSHGDPSLVRVFSGMCERRAERCQLMNDVVSVVFMCVFSGPSLMRACSIGVELSACCMSTTTRERCVFM